MNMQAPWHSRLSRRERQIDPSAYTGAHGNEQARWPQAAESRDCRMLLLGYFEGLDSERAIAWRAADSLSLREFLDVALDENPPDHSVSRTRRRIDFETHQAVFTWVL